MTSQRTLTEMPDDHMRKILEKCDLVSIQLLRKTCHSLRNFIAHAKIDPKFSTIYIKIEPDSISLTLYSQENSESITQITWEKHSENDCKVVWDTFEKSKILSGENFYEIFIRDFRSLTKSQKTPMDYFQILVINPNPQMQNFLKKFKNFGTFKPEKFSLRVTSHEEVLSILPIFDSKFLKKLEIVNSKKSDITLDLEKVVELEQWINLEEVEIQCFHVEKPERFSKFSKSLANLMTITLGEMMKLKETFLNSSSFQFCKFKVVYIDDMPQYFAALGPHWRVDSDEFGRSRHRWFYSMPDGDTVLSVQLNHYFVCFKRESYNDIPAGVVVVDKNGHEIKF